MLHFVDEEMLVLPEGRYLNVGYCNPSRSCKKYDISQFSGCSLWNLPFMPAVVKHIQIFQLALPAHIYSLCKGKPPH
jgi:hypothetical protein